MSLIELCRVQLKVVQFTTDAQASDLVGSSYIFHCNIKYPVGHDIYWIYVRFEVWTSLLAENSIGRAAWYSSVYSGRYTKMLDNRCPSRKIYSGFTLNPHSRRGNSLLLISVIEWKLNPHRLCNCDRFYLCNCDCFKFQLLMMICLAISEIDNLYLPSGRSSFVIWTWKWFESSHCSHPSALSLPSYVCYHKVCVCCIHIFL